MSIHSDLSIDIRTCGQADEDSALDRRDGLHTRAAQTRIAIDFSTEIDFSQCEGWGCVDTCIDCTPTPLLTGHALALFKVGFTVAQAQAIASGACPVCFDRHGPKACAELRVELFREEVVEV